MHLEIPYSPRRQMVPFHNRTQRWAKIVAHRRFGKTVGAVNELIKAALINTRQEPPPRYAYIAPTYSHAKDTVWHYLNYYTQPIPGLVKYQNELWIEFPNKARIRLYGAENYDRLRGLYFDGVVIDEPAEIDPRAWPEVIRPTLTDFKGWATFIGTPKGRDWFYHAGRDKLGKLDTVDWFHGIFKASETGIIPADELADNRKNQSDEQYAQEFECSFEAAIAGAYYGRLMAAADEAKRICGVPYNPEARVWTAWDLGIGDLTSIWFAQVVGREIHLIDYYEMSGVGLDHYVREIESKSYLYSGHILPHDVRAKELGTGKSRLELLEGLGLRTGGKLGGIDIAPDHRVEDGIEAVRMLIPRCWFDAAKCARGIDALKLYRAEYDDKHQVLRPKPVHDWTSHAADAFRYLALMLDRKTTDTGFGRKLHYPDLGIR